MLWYYLLTLFWFPGQLCGHVHTLDSLSFPRPPRGTRQQRTQTVLQCDHFTSPPLYFSSVLLTCVCVAEPSCLNDPTRLMKSYGTSPSHEGSVSHRFTGPCMCVEKHRYMTAGSQLTTNTPLRQFAFQQKNSHAQCQSRKTLWWCSLRKVTRIWWKIGTTSEDMKTPEFSFSSPVSTCTYLTRIRVTVLDPATLRAFDICDVKPLGAGTRHKGHFFF